MARRYFHRNSGYQSSVILSGIIVLLTTLIGMVSFRFLRDIHRNHLWKECFVSLIIFASVNAAIYYAFNHTVPEAFVCGLIITLVGFCFYWYKILSFNNVIMTADLRKEREYWWTLNGWQFEEEVANVFRLYGYNVKVTQKSGDGGVDLIMNRNGYTSIVQCKHYRNPVPPEPIRALWGCKDDFRADEVILVASSGVTESGMKFIENKAHFKLLTLDDIIYMSNKI